MASLTKLVLTLLNGVLLFLNNWLEAREAKQHEERVDAVRADPAAEWLHKFGGTKDNRTASNPADTGGSDNERVRLPPA